MKLRHLITLLVLIPSTSWSQDTSVYVSLKEALTSISEKYNVEFSYVDEVIADKKLAYDTTLELNELLPQLEVSAHLRFDKIQDGYIVVRNYRDDDLVSLCGTLTDYQGNKLIGVSIGYSQSQGVFTDENGYFKLDSIPYGAWLTLRSVSYSTKRLKVSRLDFKRCVKVRLAESIEELDEIIVSDYLATGISKNKNKIRIEPHQLSTLAGLAEPDILQSIQQVPGVSSPFETAAGIHVRGGLPDQNLVIWNGIRTYNQGHFFGMISAFNPYISDQVVFIKDATPAIYGGGISSVIDISSNANVSKTLSGGIGTNLLYADGFIDMPVISDKLSIRMSARRSFTDILSTPTFRKISDRVFQNTKIEDSGSSDSQNKNSFYFNDFSFNANWKISSNNLLNINALYNRNELDFESVDTNQNQSFNDLLLHANEGLSLQSKNAITKNFELDFSGSFTRYILRYDFIETVSDTVAQSSKKNFVQDGSFKLNTGYKFNDGSKLSAGYHLSSMRMRYAYETETPSYQIVLDRDNSVLSTHAGYAQYLLDVNGYTIQPGLRFSYYDQLNEYFLEPRLYLSKKLVDPLTVSLSGEYRTQAASQIKESVVSDLSLENKVWTVASPDRFPILRSFQTSFGTNYQYKGWYAEAEVFYKQIDGITTLIFGYLNGLESDFREGQSEINGVDVLVKKVWDKYETWLSYSYINTLNTFNGINENEDFPGSWNIKHSLRSSHIVTVADWEFSLGWQWHSGKSFTDVAPIEDVTGSVRIFYESINANNLPVYHRLDFAAMREFRSARHANLRYRIGLSLLNVYNRKNLLNREFRTTPSLENELIDTRVYSLGFTPNLVFRVFW